MDSGDCAVQGEGEDADVLMEPLFVPIKAEPEFEETSEESLMEENFERSEKLKGSSKELPQPYGEGSKPVLLPDLQCPDSCAVAPCCTTDLEAGYEGAPARYKSDGFEKEQPSGVRQTAQCEVSHFERETEVSASLRCSYGVGEQGSVRRVFECSICKKAFPWKSKLLTHIQVHTGEKPFKCSQCEKAFHRSSDLRRHLRIHTNERPYKCDQCEKSFRQSDQLTAHVRIHIGEKPYKCSECEKSFCQIGTLSNHMRIHTGERRFQCSQCEKLFLQSSDLKRHMHMHTGERPYECKQCKKSFRESGKLTAHIRIHTD